MPGVYVPLTEEGNIMVDGVLASCYTSVDHEVAHIAMTPMQRFPEIVQWIFGEDDRYSAFAKLIKVLGKSMMPDGQWQY